MKLTQMFWSLSVYSCLFLLTQCKQCIPLERETAPCSYVITGVQNKNWVIIYAYTNLVRILLNNAVPLIFLAELLAKDIYIFQGYIGFKKLKC